MTAVEARPTPGRVKLSFPGTVRGEWIKFFSLRSSYLVLSLFALVTAGFSVISCLVMRFSEAGSAMAGSHISELVAEFTIQIGSLVAGVLGALTVTNEYGSGMIRASFTAVPKRVPVVFAKACHLIIVTALASAAAILLSYGAAWLLLRSEPVDIGLTTGENPRILGGIVLFVVTIALLGLFMGLLIRSTAVSVTLVFTLVYILPALLDIVRSLVIGSAHGDYTLWRRLVLYANEVMPIAAARPLMSWDQATSDLPGLHLGPWTGLGVVGAWVVLFAFLGLLRLTKKDA
ncbi:MAG: ABC transporter permease [Propionibacteriaceae bacterium]|jgi:ABC-2 type transport system permease protein|nr:ABC transporter permease [Propionibacteriaceae bacterium]